MPDLAWKRVDGGMGDRRETSERTETKPATVSAAAAKKKPGAKKTSAETQHGKEDDDRLAPEDLQPEARPVKLPSTARSIKLRARFWRRRSCGRWRSSLRQPEPPAAYAGVLSYAHSHPGEGAAAAYLALAHANYMDHRYADAAANFSEAKRSGEALDDYADYLGAQAAIQAGRSGRCIRAAGPFRGSLSGQHLRCNRPGSAGECAPAAAGCAEARWRYCSRC